MCFRKITSPAGRRENKRSRAQGRRNKARILPTRAKHADYTTLQKYENIIRGLNAIMSKYTSIHPYVRNIRVWVHQQWQGWGWIFFFFTKLKQAYMYIYIYIYIYIYTHVHWRRKRGGGGGGHVPPPPHFFDWGGGQWYVCAPPLLTPHFYFSTWIICLYNTDK